MTSLILLPQTLAQVIPPKTQKECQEGIAMHSTAASLTVGMHFRLPPHRHESRRRWYRVIHVNADTREVTAKAIIGHSLGIKISPGVKILRLITEDPHLSKH